MHIDVADALAVQPVAVDVGEYLIGLCHSRHRQVLQQAKNGAAVAQAAAGDLADDERVGDYGAALQQFGQLRVASAQMVDPDGSVDEDQRAAAGRRRGTAVKSA